jgi:hypothetical protein
MCRGFKSRGQVLRVKLLFGFWLLVSFTNPFIFESFELFVQNLRSLVRWGYTDTLMLMISERSFNVRDSRKTIALFKGAGLSPG